MKWLMNLIAPWKSQLFAMMGVLAVCGIGAAVIGWLHIQEQDKTNAALAERNKDLTDANKTWAATYDVLKRNAQLEHDNTRLLQDKLALIEQRSATTSEQLKELEKTNGEVKEYLSRPIPADLRRLLDKQ